MSFNVAAEAYDRFMGRFSQLLAGQMADLAGVTGGDRVLDVGCGPGALTAELVRRLGPANVTAVDPSRPFVEAVRQRLPGVQVQEATAEHLPFGDGLFDVAMCQLVVHFMADPVRGLAEMVRVTRRGGAIAACVWDHHGGRGPLGLFWQVARELDPAVEDELDLAGVREGHLAELFAAAGIRDVSRAVVTADLDLPSFDAWWDPFVHGVGPAGAYVARLDPEAQARLRETCRRRLPAGPFAISARAWAARGLA